jgi:hypothetical protein
VRRPRMVISVAVALVALVAIVVGGIALGGGGDEDDNAPATPRASETPFGGGAPPPGATGSGEPVVDCMADQGFDIQSPADIDTPEEEQALQTCLESVHSGGGSP